MVCIRKQKFKFFRNILILILFFELISSELVKAQEYKAEIVSLEDYTGEFMDELDPYLSSLEEWQEMIDHWLEKPLCINAEEADMLAEYKIISLFQLNKLKEYRLIYGDLLSVYELEFIDGWDYQTCKKTRPLITTEQSSSLQKFRNFNYHSFRHNLVLKSAFITSKAKGYRMSKDEDTDSLSAYYAGSPVRLALRYDLEFRNKLAFGIRMEKDPGEPLLVNDSNLIKGVKNPDMTACYLHIKDLGPVKSIIIGNYKIGFGYGLNISGSMSGMKSRNGMAGMAGRITPQTSVSETGFWRGIAINTELSRLSLTCFASNRNLDGTSLETDSLTGRVVSFSSLDQSGLHRSDSELEGRRSISENMFGGFLIFRNQWLKTGIIAIYNSFNAKISDEKRSYDQFGLRGKENLVGGFSATAWLSKIQLITELSVSKNSGHALLAGLQVTPVPGALISMAYRNFGTDYQNWNGSGFVSAGRNSAEEGIQVKFRLELPRKYLLDTRYDYSRNRWITYDLAAPSNKHEISLLAEKSWTSAHSVNFAFRYIRAAIEDDLSSEYICHPLYSRQYKIRLEHRIEASENFHMKSRIECNYSGKLPIGWMVLQDFEIPVERFRSKLWMRVCFFDIMQYENSIYAYENDVQYDFTSFMHYGKGLRGVIMLRQSVTKWIDVWLRYSTVYYTNKNIGTGWDETGSNRQNEFDIQARIRWPG